jgi:hypothetical protein
MFCEVVGLIPIVRWRGSRRGVGLVVGRVWLRRSLDLGPGEKLEGAKKRFGGSLTLYRSGVTVESSLSEDSGPMFIWFKPVEELCSGLLFLMATIMVTGG